MAAEDSDGWYHTQLWALMRDFGQMMLMGYEPPFSTDIEIDT